MNNETDARTVKLKPEHIAVMDTLITSFERAKQHANEAFARMNAYAEQCATLCGIEAKEFELNWDLKAFVPKTKSIPPNGHDTNSELQQ